MINTIGNETKNILVGIQVPVMIPSSEVVGKFEGELPPAMQKLVEAGHMTTEEVVSFLQFGIMMGELGHSIDEFLALYRNIKEEMERKQSNIILPNIQLPKL